MKIYQFRAGTPKDDRVMGISYPAAFMVPVAMILIVFEFVFPHKNITGMASSNIYLELIILVPAFVIGAPVAIWIKKKCGHDFKVQFENKQISVWMDGEFQYKDNLEDISIQENSKQLKLTIYGSKEKTTFIGRDISNIFGFCRKRDLSILKELAQDLHGLVK